MNKKRQRESGFSFLHFLRKQGSLAAKDPRFHGGYKRGESGNALIYVLIAIALFAALSFTLGRQTDTGETGGLSDDRASLVATQLISYTAQAKSALDQMLFTGAFIEDIDFVLPSDVAFNSGSHINKIYHPDGGGLNVGTLPEAAIAQNISDPPAGWYMGRFNNVDWTETGSNDVILVAYQINQQVCQQINVKVTGTTAIPVMRDSIKEVMIDDSFYSAGTNTDLTTDTNEICEECREMSSLCVQNEDQNAYGFYTILVDQ